MSNLHLGARDPVGGGFVMLGKTFKGMTDQMLAWQTERLLRFARVTRYREDKSLADADTIDTVRDIYAAAATPLDSPQR